MAWPGRPGAGAGISSPVVSAWKDAAGEFPGRRFLEWAWRWGPVLLWMAGIFFFSSLSSPLGPVSDSSHSGLIGRAAHVLEYAGLAALMLRALGWQRYGVTLFVTLAYALSDELHQALVPGREFALSDLATDAVGALMALGLARAGCSIWEQRRP